MPDNNVLAFDFGSARVTLWVDRPLHPVASPSELAAAPAIPRIGSEFGGGIYAGIVRGDEGEPDYRLVLCSHDAGRISWTDALAMAAKLSVDDGLAWSLPKRKEQAILFGNVPELFEKEAYWSCEQCAGDAGYAWYQYFYGGTSTTATSRWSSARAPSADCPFDPLAI